MSLFGDTPPQPNFQDDDHLLLFKLASAAYNLSLGGGGGGSGITALTGDVTASGSGSVAATVAKIQGVAISGAAAAGNVLTASGAAAASWQAPSSGGTPGLPVWTFAAADSSDPASGKFTTNNASTASTGLIRLSRICKGGTDLSTLLINLPPIDGQGSTVFALFTDSTGKTYSMKFISISPAGDFVEFLIGSDALNPANWSGDYQVAFAPGFTAPPLLSAVLAASSITPDADGTTTPVTSVTTQSGIVTALS